MDLYEIVARLKNVEIAGETLEIGSYKQFGHEAKLILSPTPEQLQELKFDEALLTQKDDPQNILTNEDWVITLVVSTD